MDVKIKDERGRGVEHEEDEQEAVREAWDDVTGKELDGRDVRRARMKEIGYVRDKKVWVNISREEARRKGIKVIQTRRIDIDKGDEDNPHYRSRFVGKEFNVDKQHGLFAATPPLEALKLLVSDAATYKEDDEQDK